MTCANFLKNPRTSGKPERERAAARRNALHWLLAALCVGIVVIAPYLNRDNHDPEQAVLGAAFHVFEWLFIRLAPAVLLGAIVGAVLTRKRA